MMKHVSGIDQFLIGITQSLNNSNNFLTIGLVSETVPVKANMNGSALSFTDLVESIMQTLEKMASVAPRASFGEFAAKLGLAFDFPLRFAFYQQQQTEMWKEAGLSVAADLLEVDSEKGSRLWSVNGLSTYDAKLIIVEDLGVVRCVFKFRKDRLQRETVERWVSKYQTTLDGLNSSAKKTLTVGRLISRYYNT
ncbi:hypothetical protein BDR26DRAFT_852410 [Obelidium mucronatum]|nr:hypothetical protein BDR26DRAFT_852410 [Obelidium mucronatum]